jgi:hypothetical protein
VQVCLDQLHCSEKSVSDEKKNEKKRSPRCQLKDISLSREKCSQKPQILPLKNHPKLKASPQLNH